MSHKKPFIFFIVTTIFLFLSSCQGKLGSAIILWSNQEDLLPTGSLVNVVSESQINGSYVVKIKGEREKYEIATWRVLLIDKNQDSQVAYESFQTWANLYGRCEKSGLPIRSEPTNQGNNTIYKLRENQEVKVIDRQEEPVEIGNLQGYWYKLLTEDGVEGWCFDYYLQIYSIGNDAQPTIQNEREVQDQLLLSLYNTPYYPIEVSDMIAAGRVDLNRIRQDHYFSIDPNTKKIRLKTSDHNIEVNYESVALISFQKYSFIGTSFQLEANSSSLISLQFNKDGREYREGFATVEQPMEEILQEELERRLLLTQNFSQRGPTFSSDTYGIIEFSENGRFHWQDKSMIISRNLLSSQSGNEGNFYFDLFADPSFARNYDGTLTLKFDSGESLPFLYEWKPRGVLLIYIPEIYIEKSMIQTDVYRDPLQIFFKKVTGEE